MVPYDADDAGYVAAPLFSPVPPPVRRTGMGGGGGEKGGSARGLGAAPGLGMGGGGGGGAASFMGMSFVSGSSTNTDDTPPAKKARLDDESKPGRRGGLGWSVEEKADEHDAEMATASPVVSDDSGSDSSDTETRQAYLERRDESETSHGEQGNSGEHGGSLGFKSSFAQKLMERLGWRSGKGLGLNATGDAQSIDTTKDEERAFAGSALGLGFTSGDGLPPGGFERKRHQIDQDQQVPISQTVDLIRADASGFNYERGKFPSSSQLLTVVPFSWHHARLDDYLNDENKQSTEAAAGQESLPDVTTLWKAKSRLDQVDRKRFLQARFPSNPYESVGKHFFMNRAAMKMAELDLMYGLTQHADQPKPDPATSPGRRESLDRRRKFLNFADICAGPGAFSEYMMWRRKTLGAKGFGFTLAGKMDFKLHKFHPAAPCTNFERHYGDDGTGDVTNSDNIRSFAELVHAQTEGRGVDLLTGDGGASVEGDENDQETLLKQLVLAQCLTALMTVAEGGDFVCKLFDSYTPFTVGLLFIMYRCFSSFALVKPFSSRPANSERYLVCLGLRERAPAAVTDFLFRVNDKINSLSENRGSMSDRPEEDIGELVDATEIQADRQFTRYLKSVNSHLLQRQVYALQTLFLYIEDPDLPPLAQDLIRTQCLELWGIPLTAPSGGTQNRGASIAMDYGTGSSGSRGGRTSVAEDTSQKYLREEQAAASHTSRLSARDLARQRLNAAQSRYGDIFGTAATPTPKVAQSAPTAKKTIGGGVSLGGVVLRPVSGKTAGSASATSTPSGIGSLKPISRPVSSAPSKAAVSAPPISSRASVGKSGAAAAPRPSEVMAQRRRRNVVRPGAKKPASAAAPSVDPPSGTFDPAAVAAAKKRTNVVQTGGARPKFDLSAIAAAKRRTEEAMKKG
jgi:23S rRNA U2552 (ribose-2'-O)-methylase RlmE/FtsJ